MIALTTRQQEIYDYLADKIRNRGYGPTVREIGEHFGIRSPNGVMCHLKALERKDLITRESHMSRAIQLTQGAHPKSMERVCPCCQTRHLMTYTGGQWSELEPIVVEAAGQHLGEVTA